jgi:hypothetical protein
MSNEFPVELIPQDEPKHNSISLNIETESISKSAKDMCERVGMAVSATGIPYANMDNVYRVLNYFNQALTFDEFHQKVFKSDGKEWEESDTLEFAMGLQREVGC